MVRRFTVFDGGERKIARHQQYFGVREAVDACQTVRVERSPQGWSYLAYPGLRQIADHGHAGTGAGAG